jgi:uncharacterized protein (TIGR00730 family)
MEPSTPPAPTSASVRKKRVAVYCSSAPEISPEFLKVARDVGAGIGSAGFDLVWGGGQISMMGEVSRSAREHGASTFGVIPEKLLDKEFLDKDSTEIEVVSDMRVRKAKMEVLADAFIVLPGGIGTLEEFFEIWVGRYLGFHNKPIAVCDPIGAWSTMQLALGDLTRLKLMKEGQNELVLWSHSIDHIITDFSHSLN